MDEIISQPEETRETGEKTESTEARKLDEATFEPKAHVERTGDYKQSEAIQTDFTSVVNNAASSTQNAAVEQDKSVSGQQPKLRGDLEEAKPSESSDDDKPAATPINLPGVQNLENPDVVIQDLTQNKLGKDPLTGDEFGGQNDDVQAQGQEATVGDEASGEYSLDALPGEPVSDAEAADPSQAQAADNTVEVGKLEGTDIAGIPQGKERLIPEDLVQKEKGLIGEGTHGMLDGSGPGKTHSGPVEGYGPGYQEGSHSTKVPGSNDIEGYKNKYGSGSSSSGGGLPVHGYGPGMYGEDKGGGTKFNYTEKDKHGNSDSGGGKSNDSAGKTARRAFEMAQMKSANQGSSGKYTISGDDGIYVVNWNSTSVSMSKIYNPLEGGSPIPYTGSGVGGEKPEPQSIGGADQESGHFNVVVSVDGKMVGGSGSGGGEPGTSGDEGHWYGGLFASADRPNNPDDPDYYTPNVLDEADKAKKAAS